MSAYTQPTYTQPSQSAAQSTAQPAHTPAPTATTLADLVDTKPGSKRKRPSTHVEGISLQSILALVPAPVQRVVCTPRRLAAAPVNEPAPAKSEDVEMEESDDDCDDSDDDVEILM
ncbi:hypothetical protein Q8F55_001139 [Vanrija albida]|uniref:Uncharacterized protein n=1 Tax=Vanrija albida TaxID=181172 RepID=A0ABR3QF74_9TREE